MATKTGEEPIRIGVASVEPVQDIVEAVRELLAKAESGEVRGIAYVTLLTNKATGYGVVGAEATGGYLRVSGLLLWLANRCARWWEEKSPEDS